MADAAFYREAAKRHRELAAATSIPEQAAQPLDRDLVTAPARFATANSKLGR